jgi:hypothetical protein
MAWLGVTLETTAVTLGWMGFLGSTVLAAALLWKKNMGLVAALIVPPLTVLSPFVHATAYSGLETGLYCLMVLTTIFSLNSGRYRFAAGIAGCALLIRPDGALLLALTLLLALRRSAKEALVCLVISALFFAPWLIFAQYEYGSFLPHSIEAKRIIHPGSLLVNLTVMSNFLFVSPSFLALFTLGFSGLILSSSISGPRRQLYLLTLVWLLLYISGLAFSGVRPIFFWYYVPMLVVASTIGLPALVDFARSERSAPFLKAALTPQGVTIAVLCFLALSSAELLWRGSSLNKEQARHVAYHQIADRLSGLVRSGEKVFLCETGIIGYRLPQAIILDSAGINSKEIVSILKNHPADWLQLTLERFEPEWIVSPMNWCEVGMNVDEPWFKSRYTLQWTIAPSLLGGIAVFKSDSKQVATPRPHAETATDLFSKDGKSS